MITPELIGYIRGEFANGKTREEINAELVKNGGWNEIDLIEAFKTAIPVESVQSIVTPKTELTWSFWKIILIVVILGVLFLGGWFYRAPLMSLWNRGVDKVTGLAASYFGPKTPPNNIEPVTPLPERVETPTANIGIRDCGIGTAPDLKNPLTYENNAVLSCLGNSALNCEEAKAVLTGPLFPGVFEITRQNIENQETCNFKLSYGSDSALTDITGRKLAGQYISCPLSIVKAIDETKTPQIFSIPSTENLGKYASQIYFYGVLGVFMENNVDKNKIQALGCSGPYIDSIVASYRKIQGKK